ncbi:hypothetical protein C8Q76DRAFT_599173, partial [Earliella scabrosa]
DVRDATKQDYLLVDLAPSFGLDIKGGKVAALDDSSKAMVAGTMRSLRSHRQNVGRFDWPTLTSLFMQNTMLAPLDDEIRRND